VSSIQKILDTIKVATPQEKIDELVKITEQERPKNVTFAVELIKEAKRLSEEHFYTKGLSDSLILLGKIYQNISNYGGAMKAALQAKELCISQSDIKGEADCLDILGGVYNFLGDYNKRLDCNLNCLLLREKAGDISDQLSTMNNIGDTYMVMGDFENALKYFEQCLSFPNLEDRIQAIVYYNIGEVYFNLKDYSKAQINIDNGVAFGKKSEYWQIIIVSYQLEAMILIAQNENEKAIDLLNKAIKIALENENKEDEYALYRNLADAYGNVKEHKKAYYYLNKYNHLKEELANNNDTQKLKKIEFEFQFKSIKTEAEETKEKNKLLTRAFSQIETQRNEIELKNLSITDSIHYAKKIQNSILPSRDKIKSILKDAFVFYQPKDIVSGDFYWINKIGDEVIFSVIDCTGHGVPGAFVSLIANNALNKVILEKQITEPAKVLEAIDKIMISSFASEGKSIRDGMDMGICNWNQKTNTIQFSGAYHSLFICENDELKEVKGNRESIGYSLYKEKMPFINHTLDIEKGSNIYLSSDGFPDQFGGVKGKKLKWKGLRNQLLEASSLSIEKQLPFLQSFFTEWRNDLEQVDDICVIGVSF
jgi:serine phosphatase RsbU (regulator of sigma subunit)